ncbi:hypothetical protein KKB10_03040 [Patescibacteria group bacterium]|nr:hypothetical protein [Patescibacteria group bacterium]MBU1951852.1 hypothetical protein [Patescibacteria group bacterium]MBU2229085.1 hypothetical protein [Patescibacteria group bacterium]
MKKVFISGSINIKNLHKAVIDELDSFIKRNCFIIIGDAYGIDQLVQKYLLSKKYYNVLICTIYEYPRIIESNEFDYEKIKYDLEEKSEKKKQSYKDKHMTEISDISLVIWDGKSTGSYRNIIDAIERNKEVKVFLDNKFMKLIDINVKAITNIFYERHEYSLTEYLSEVVKKDKNCTIKSTKQMKEILKDRGVLTGNGVIDNKFIDSVTIDFIRGNRVYKYKKKLLDNYFSSYVNKNSIENLSLF